MATGDIIKLVDSHSGELTSYEEVTVYADGTPMDDTKLDPAIYRKKGGLYYKRAFTGPINVKWFGTDGNANYDNGSGEFFQDPGLSIPATDDSQALQAAANIASKLQQDILIPPGGYITTGITFSDTSNIKITGYGATLIAKAATKTYILTIVGDTTLNTEDFLYKNFTIEGIKFNGNANFLTPPEPGEGDGWNALRLLFVANVTVQNCQFLDTYNKSLAIDVCHGVTIADCSFDHDYHADSIYLYCASANQAIKTKNILVQRNVFNNAPRGYVFCDGFINGVVVENNLMGNKTQVFVNNRAVQCRNHAQNIIIRNNVMMQGGSLAWIRGLFNNVIIDSNTVFQCNLHAVNVTALVGADLSGNQDMSPVGNSKNITITNNSFTDACLNIADSVAATIQISTFDGVATDGNTYQLSIQNTKIQGNTIDISGTTPSAKNNYGIYALGRVNSRLKQIRINSNNITGSNTSNINIQYTDGVMLQDTTTQDSKDTNIIIQNSSDITAKNIKVQGAGAYGGAAGRKGINFSTCTSVTADNIRGEDTQAKMDYVISGSGTDFSLNRVFSPTLPQVFDNGITYSKEYINLNATNQANALQLGQIIKRLPVYDKIGGTILGYQPIYGNIVTEANTNISGTVVDMNLSKFYKNIAADTTLTLINSADGKEAKALITNTDAAAHTITVGASVISVAASSSKVITIYQINGAVVAQ